MTSSTRTITKAPAAEEDLLYGEGIAQQMRAGVPYNVTKIRGFRPVNDITELNNLNPTKFPKAVLVENGALAFYKYNGAAYEALTILTKITTIVSEVTSFSAISLSTVLLSSGTPQSINNITNGIAGQELKLIATNGNTTIENTASIVLKGGSDYPIPSNTGLTLVYTGSVWAEV